LAAGVFTAKGTKDAHDVSGMAPAPPILPGTTDSHLTAPTGNRGLPTETSGPPVEESEHLPRWLVGNNGALKAQWIAAPLRDTQPRIVRGFARSPSVAAVHEHESAGLNGQPTEACALDVVEKSFSSLTWTNPASHLAPMG